ncbi:MAG: DUF3105 domain-containing protein [Actinomycetota bacterium]
MDPPPSPPSRRFSRSDAAFLVLAVVLLAAIGSGLAWAFLADRDSEVRRPTAIIPTSPTGPPSATPSSPSAQGSCRPVQMVPPFDSEPGDRAHAEVPLSRYPSIPPASGPHAPRTVPAGFYEASPGMGEVIHSLEHGAVVIWFDPSVASSEALQQLREFMGPSGPGQDVHIIIAPYDYPDEGVAGRLPPGVVMVMVAWHWLQSCAALGPDELVLAADFVQKYRCQPGCDLNAYRGEAPEAGAPI